MNKLPLEETLYRRTLKQGWIIIFADLLALLLTFFVLIFSMNAIQYEDWQSVVTSLSDQLNPSRAEISKQAWQGRETTKVYDPFAISLDYLQTVLEQKIETEEMLNGMSLYRLEDSLVITLPVGQLFESREIRLSRQGKLMLGELSLLMRQLSNRISVIGHTDLTVPNSRFFSSSWDLSLNRSVVVAGGMAEAGYTGPITALGFGDSRFQDIDSRLELSERYRLARRIDVIVHERKRKDADNVGL
jgi:chemotaxis protein MotB